MNNLVNVTNVKKKIHSFSVGPLDLLIEPGTITALIGNNGSGKSTFIKMLMNLAKPDEGNVQIMDRWVTSEDESWKEHVAYLPQKQTGFDPYTGSKLKKLISGLYPVWDETLFQQLASDFDLPLHKKYESLSPGVQQKLNLALTIPRNVPLMILDEPTNFMDIPSKKILMDTLAKWMENGERSILFASHQTEEIQKLADYLMIIKDGQQIGTFEKDELLEQYMSYWLNEHEKYDGPITGAVQYDGNVLLSENPDATEKVLTEFGIGWHSRSTPELEEIVSLLMK